ncbi:MAG: glycosyltransferase [Actinomycetota bacterium]
MTADPVVSVVMPLGGVDARLEHQLHAIATQTHPGPIEIVCSLNTAEEHHRVRLGTQLARTGVNARIVDSSDERNAAHARNVGAGAASGELLLFCDGDDIVDAEWVAAMAEALAGVDAVGGYLDERLLAVPGQETWRPPATPGTLPTFLDAPYLVSANLGVRRDAFDAVGGFDTSLTRGEDIALSWDLMAAGYQLGYAPGAIVHYRHRRGVWPMMRQHFLYGVGFSELVSRRSVPGEHSRRRGLRLLQPNGQPAPVRGWPWYVRRGSIAAGRLVGLVAEHRRASAVRFAVTPADSDQIAAR